MIESLFQFFIDNMFREKKKQKNKTKKTNQFISSKDKI